MFYGRKLEPAHVQGTCTAIGCPNPQGNKGNGRFRALCHKHHKQKCSDAYREKLALKVRKTFEGQPKLPYRAHKKTYCEKCGPKIAYHPCQLDVDHIDGDHSNDAPKNLQTLCANCHRLKTHLGIT